MIQPTEGELVDDALISRRVPAMAGAACHGPDRAVFGVSIQPETIRDGPVDGGSTPA
jgi:hypothetical protein